MLWSEDSPPHSNRTVPDTTKHLLPSLLEFGYNQKTTSRSHPSSSQRINQGDRGFFFLDHLCLTIDLNRGGDERWRAYLRVVRQFGRSVRPPNPSILVFVLTPIVMKFGEINKSEDGSPIPLRQGLTYSHFNVYLL